MRGVHANDWSGDRTTVDLRVPLPQGIADALERNHNIARVELEPHRLTVHVTIANSIGDGDAASTLRDYLDGSWHSKPY